MSNTWKPITFTTAQGKQKQDNMNKSTIAFFNCRGSCNIGHRNKIQSARRTCRYSSDFTNSLDVRIKISK